MIERKRPAVEGRLSRARRPDLRYRVAMPYDERLAARVRDVLSSRSDVVEKKMFGGLCFMVNGSMCCGITKDDFMVKVGREHLDESLARAHARPMDFTGRPSTSAVYVAREGLRTRAALEKWVSLGVAQALGAPKRPKRSAAALKRRARGPLRSEAATARARPRASR